MKLVNEAVLYANSQRVGTIAVEMLDGAPHAATVHFAVAEEPLLFYFETCRNYRKAEPILNRESVRASLVIGQDENNPKTLQLDGLVRLVSGAELTECKKVYLEKFPEKIEKTNDDQYFFFSFEPTWWRFTDWTLPEGKKIWLSN